MLLPLLIHSIRPKCTCRTWAEYTAERPSYEEMFLGVDLDCLGGYFLFNGAVIVENRVRDEGATSTDLPDLAGIVVIFKHSASKWGRFVRAELGLDYGVDRENGVLRYIARKREGQ